MLSRVAERIYWFARYLERVESMARLIQVYTKMLSDLPRDSGISWHNLVIASGSRAEFERRFTVQDEKRVVRFLLEDLSNPGSMMSSLRMVKENIRTTRDVLPPETWEMVNEFRYFVSENVHLGINRRNRHAFLDEVIGKCQQINGLMADTMRRDTAYHFLRLGRYLERADMTLRTLEAGAWMLGDFIEDDSLHAGDVVWSSVLRTLDAMMPFRRTMRVALNGEDAAQFLLEDTLFPRSVMCCLNQMMESGQKIPGSPEGCPGLDSVLAKIEKGVDYSDPAALLKHFDVLQRDLGHMHGCIAETWFHAH
ncbi:alpha-E domain-containing protein [Spongiibacter sp. KMU-158]|uniref:Alpha-E domain-containing protein n=1 Tax=Spongiibacter pelagi TaxID=2760804 RepID=A0A927C4E3_9GAMM|nr:alpha-E domain-containing protein [Spongiibacter pelagi]MBD2859551.1 alpha-E domain-containing protein [Spongiibacter pelagi]